MGLSAGTRLGPYEILAPIGAGGMGEVYRARDTRLGRDVAVKVLPDEVAGDPNALSRFEREAKAVASLSHPNILALFDVGESGGVHYAVTELLQGQTLRLVLSEGPLPVRRALDIAVQVAEGLTAAHENGIVHRDLKPENVFVGNDGHVKLLDFGLARQDASRQDPSDTRSPTVTNLSRPGSVSGTVAYMSPEQAKGNSVDFRSDQFSLGIVLYEMLAGVRPFHGDSAAETLTSIIREEPKPLEKAAPNVPAPIRWIVERCLAKEPAGRYDSTRDLARELATGRIHISEVVSEATAIQGPVGSISKSTVRLWLSGGALGMAIALALAFFLGRRTVRIEPPTFQRLTFRRGIVESARFAPDGQTVLYSASWDGNPSAIYMKRPESMVSLPVDAPSALLLAVSPAGEMAIRLREGRVNQVDFTSTLARVPLTGGTPRELAEDVVQADWGPNESLVVIRRLNGKDRLDYPLGKVLYETTGHVSLPRISPRGDLIAFADHARPPGDDTGSIAVVDLNGRKRTLSEEFDGVNGLAWSPSGEEVWFTTYRELRGVTLSGRQRVIFRPPGVIWLKDVTRSGRVLLAQGEQRMDIRWLVPGETRERDVSWLGYSGLSALASDGRTIVFGDLGADPWSIWLGRPDSRPVRLGEGWPGPPSPDGKWVMSAPPKPEGPIVLLPTGSGEPKKIDKGGIGVEYPRWLPDGRRIVFLGREAGHGVRLFVVGLDGGKPHSISPEGIPLNRFAVSPDGKLLAAIGPDRKITLYPVDGGEPRPAPGAAEDEPVQWSADGRSLYGLQGEWSPSARILRLDLTTGERALWKELSLEGLTGATGIGNIRLTPDGRGYAYNCLWRRSDLELVEGLK